MVTPGSRRFRALSGCAFAATLGIVACGKGGNGAEGSGSAKPRSSAALPLDAARRPAILSAEQRRSSRDILDTDLSSRDVSVRRAAARALSRIADARSVEHLLKTLSDEDDEVVTWSAYGLGFACPGREDGVVKRLSARAASLLVARTDDKTASAPKAEKDGGAAAKAPVLAGPLAAISGALARCGTPEAERALRAWLGAERSVAEEAAFGLGTIVVRTGRLDDATLVGLLDAASRPKAPIPNALYPFARLLTVNASVRARLLDVARRALDTPGVERVFAVRALAVAGDEAAPELARIVGSPAFTDAERADAARALGRLGEAGQKSLDASLEALLSDPAATSESALASSRFGVLTTLLDAFTLPLGKSAPLLARLAELPLPTAPAARNRAVAIRCRAADLLAGRGTLSPKLLACDPDPNGRAGRFAFLRVLGRGSLEGARFRRFSELVRSNDAAIRQRALELLEAHAEARGIPEFLAQALASKSPGDVATAAALLAKRPDRASGRPSEKPQVAGADAGLDASSAQPPSLAPQAPSPDAAVVRALTKALDDWSKGHDIETRTALIDAAGALELLGAKSRLELDCKSPHPELRKHAEKALARLGQRDRRCDTFEPDYAPPGELARVLTAPKKLTFETDAGPLVIELHPSLAPVASTRLADLARAGFFDGVAVHRVVPGFVVQLGDPGGDGYGGAKGPPLRCETSPTPFEHGTVGIALGGRDTGSSQFFVTLGRHPHLDGEYAVVGTAGPGWDRVAVGDIVRKVRVGD